MQFPSIIPPRVANKIHGATVTEGVYITGQIFHLLTSYSVNEEDIRHIYPIKCKILQLWLGRDGIFKIQHTLIPVMLKNMRFTGHRYVLKYEKICLLSRKVSHPLKQHPCEKADMK
jgi:hypothetical protein